MLNFVINVVIHCMEKNNKYLITVIGPTAIGKTALAINLAKYFETEIISADSRQFFKEMKIGTAVPSKEELNAAPHHFIQHKSIHDYYSVGEFERDAIDKLNVLFKKYNVVIMVGGSGLYVNAVLNGLDDFPEINTSIRENLNEELIKNGIEPLQIKLRELDPIQFKNIDLDNPQRLIRALEVCIGTGKPYSSFLKKKPIKRKFTSIKVGLTAERDIIYNRINQRVDIMIQEGLLNEAKCLFKHKQLNALQTVGYKELFKYFEDEWTLEFAVSEIKKNTRRFAKRQLTWFKKDENTNWYNYKTPIEKILSNLIKT